MARYAIAAVWLVAALGCASRYDKLVKSARRAETRGDNLAAARHYREACRERGKPDDEACVAAAANARVARDAALTAAALPCRNGDVRACHRALAPARELDAADPSARALLDEAGDVHAARCERRDAEDPSARVRVAACLARVEDVVAAPAYRERASAARRRAAAAFARLARDPATAAHPGARALLLDAALAHVDDAELRAARDTARARFEGAAQVPLQVVLRGRGAGSSGDESLCASLELGARVRCAGGARDARALSVTAALQVAPVRYQTWTEQHSTRYQSGTIRYPNPELEGAQRRLGRAERALQDVERDRVDARVECESAKRAEWSASGDDRAPAEEARRRACERADGIERIYERRADERERARRALDDTPAFLEEPEYATHQWTSRHFEWSAPFSFRIEAGEGARSGDGVARVTAREQDGFSPAGIERVRRGREPTPRELFGQARERVRRDTRALVDGVLRARADRRAAACTGAVQWTGPWLQCRAEAQLWRGEALSAAGLLRAVLE